jgi:hypothetical protein
MKVYISGPMSGLPDLNFPAFNAEAERLRALGYDVVNPAELNPDPTKPWHACMRVDIAALMSCDVIAMLPGWERSKGAKAELQAAGLVDIPVAIAAQLTGPLEVIHA